jgi:ABC-type phosphate transport system substrate-binding protein
MAPVVYSLYSSYFTVSHPPFLCDPAGRRTDWCAADTTVPQSGALSIGVPTHPQKGEKLRNRSKLLAGASAAIAALGILGLAGTAQAQTGAAALATPSVTVAAGLETAIVVKLPTGCTGPVKPITGIPPNGSTTNLKQINTGTTTKPFVRISGMWPPPSSDPQTIALGITCANGKTGSQNVVDESAPVTGDFTGSGSDTIESVMDQFSADFNASHSTGKLWSFDALNPICGSSCQGDTIVTKHTSTDSTTCSQPRPFGSGAGIMALENTKKLSTGAPCLDFARSSSGRAGTDPPTISYITLAGDAVTVATQPGTNAPLSLLTTSALQGIYNCTITKWNQIPGNTTGSSDTIIPMLPQSASGTRKFFLVTALGLPNTAAPCVSTSATRQGAAGNADNTLEENEGVDPSLNMNTKDVIFPFSVGKWIAQRFHSASCGTVSQCFANESHCTPTSGQNLFGCNLHGTMALDSINGTAPTVGTGKSTTINPGFTAGFTRPLFEVVNAPQGTVPSNLAPLFGPTGFTCTSSTAKTDLKNYGFLVLPAGTAPGDCGSAG